MWSFHNSYVTHELAVDLLTIKSKISKKSVKIPKGYSESVNRRTGNIMAKRQKNRQHNGQKTEEQATLWPKDRRTGNIMAQMRKDKQRSTKHYT